MDCPKKKTIIIALTGASGIIYGIRLIKALLEADIRTIVLVSKAAEIVLVHEMKIYREDFSKEISIRYSINSQKMKYLQVFSYNDIAAGPASGSFVHQGMVVVPCSMKTLAAVSSGFADNLITRSCDVCIKERRPLILVPRETPFNQIHLENMLRVSRAGAIIIPPNPSFYTMPKTIDELVDTVVSRILDHLGLKHNLSKRWPL